MRGFLLDTNILVISLTTPERIPKPVRERVEEGTVYVTVVSYWEIMLKALKGKLEVGDPRAWWAKAVDELAAICIPFRPDHVSAIWDLPLIHQDPFDRALIAQSIVEELTLVTTDRAMESYRSERFAPLVI